MLPAAKLPKWLLVKPNAATWIILRRTSRVIFMVLPQTYALKADMYCPEKHNDQFSAHDARGYQTRRDSEERYSLKGSSTRLQFISSLSLLELLQVIGDRLLVAFHVSP